ncbi:DNA-3-methyladenine glycosylase [Fodinibius roseus]|uniref:Putative 3-methyladenine DNA glycosylase n=1 Tax=Fodinibius roseus TaxID=1194090 RepID=A0A1M5AKX1_9BACT|nr:DNA-3-methyladenine glycosylase [Fodinibius roseus]SHF30873.1 DNA-3-methyladenine glycosylase [Fodinibius roseus]
MSGHKLPLSFYRQPDVVRLSRQLVGKVLCTQTGDTPVTSGIITETEAYSGRNDKASHAHGGRRTQRTETMYRAGGIGYVYLCYGIHHLFNVVTNTENEADAVLIRAIEPLEGREMMMQRRGADRISPSLTAGPGRLSQALNITTALDGIDLTGNTIWIEDRDRSFADHEMVAAPRVGVDYAGEDARLPRRFYVRGNRWVSAK